MKPKQNHIYSDMKTHNAAKVEKKVVCAIVAAGLLSFAGVATETAMNLAFPQVMDEFGVTTDTVQWLTTGYLLVLSLVIPLSSYFKKRFTNKKIFVAAAAIFTIGTLSAMLGESFALLLLGRLVQGLGTGIGLPLMFNIILEQTPKEHIGSMVGVACLVVAVAPAVGPFAGGFIITYWGWRMIFAVLLPVLLLSFLLGLSGIKQVTATQKVSFQWADYCCIVMGFTAFVLGTSCSAELGWLHPLTLGLLTASVIALYGFYCRAAKQAAPLLDVGVFKNSKFCLSLLSIILVQFVVLGLSFLLPNYAQLTLGASPFQAGMVLIPGCLVGFIVTPLGGRFLDRFGAARPIIAGNLLMLAGMVGIGALLHIGPTALAAAYAVFACGQALTAGNTFTNAMAQLDTDLQNSGNAVFNTFQQLAGAAGTSVTASIVAAQQVGSADMAASTALGSIYAIILLTALIMVILFCSGRLFNLRLAFLLKKKFAFSYIIFLQALLIMAIKVLVVIAAYADLLHIGHA